MERPGHRKNEPKTEVEFRSGRTRARKFPARCQNAGQPPPVKAGGPDQDSGQVRIPAVAVMVRPLRGGTAGRRPVPRGP